MRLPEINYAVNTPIVPKIDDPNRDIKIGLGLIGAGAEVFRTVKDDIDRSKATEISAKTQKDLRDLEDYLSSGERININDPRMPDEVRSKVMTATDEKDPSKMKYADTLSADGDMTFANTKDVLIDVKSHYRKRFEESLASVPEGYREQFARAAEEDWMKFEDRVMGKQRQYVLQDTQRSYMNGISNYVQAGNMDMALDAARAGYSSNVFTEDQAAKISSGIVEQFQSRFDTDVKALNDQIGQAAFHGDAAQIDLLQDQYNSRIAEAVDVGLISPEDANAYVAEADAAAEKLRFRGEITRLYDSEGIQSAINALRTHEYKKPEGVSQEDWLKTVDAARADINKRYADESKIKADMKEQVGVDAALIRSSQLISAGMPVASKDDKKVMDVSYENTMQYGWTSQNPEDRYKWAEGSYNMVKQTGYVPNGLQEDMVRMIGIGEKNPQAAVMAAELYMRFKEIPSLVDDTTSIENAVLLEEIGANSRAGLSPAEAYELAKQEVTMDRGEKEVLAAQWKSESGNTEKQLKRITKATDDKYDQWFKKDPAKSKAYLAQFKELEQTNFMLTGDIEKATQFAVDRLNKVWRVTDVNGQRELMQLPPEASYGAVNGSTDWIKQQWETEKARAFPDLVAKYGAENILLESDWYTGRTDNPTYAIKIRDPNQLGVMFNATKDNVRVRWYPDIKQNGDYQLQERVQAEERQSTFSEATYQKSVADRVRAKMSPMQQMAEEADLSYGVDYAKGKMEQKMVRLQLETFAELEAEREAVIKAIKRDNPNPNKALAEERRVWAETKAAYQAAKEDQLKRVYSRLNERWKEKAPAKYKTDFSKEAVLGGKMIKKNEMPEI